MPTQAPLDILKEAILLEKRGRAFYENAAAGSTNAAVKEFFQAMAEEERGHIAILAEQYKSYQATHAFAAVDSRKTSIPPVAENVLTEDLKNRIAGAGFEAAAISAAMLMEEKAVALYADRAKATGDAQEKALYRWLAEWEQGHLTFLARLDQEIKEALWQDNQFWPM